MPQQPTAAPVPQPSAAAVNSHHQSSVTNNTKPPTVPTQPPVQQQQQQQQPPNVVPNVSAGRKTSTGSAPGAVGSVVSQPQEKPQPLAAAVQPSAPVVMSQHNHPQPPGARPVSLANVAPVAKKPPTSGTAMQLPPPLDTTGAYTDPLERSLASLEQDIIKSESMTCPLSSIPAIPNIPNINPSAHHMAPLMPPNSMMHPMHAGVMDGNEMPPVIPPISSSQNMLHSNNNGFGAMKQELDMPMNNNGLSMGMPMNMAMGSIFDPLPSVTQPQQMPPTMSQALPPVKKEEKPMIHPKPLEELSNPSPIISGMNNSNDKKMTPPEQKNLVAANFASAFKPKQEQNIKNASSWSSLAQANSPQNSSTSGVSNRQMADSFQQFKKQAKEKADRQKALLEQQEMRRQQKEQAEKERLRAENERRREKEEEEALEKARWDKITKLQSLLSTDYHIDVY